MDRIIEPSELVGSASVLLKWAFLGSSLLSAAELVQRPDLSPRRPVCVTLVDFAYLLCNMFTAATVFWANATSTFPGRSHVVSDVAVAVAVVWLTASAICQRWKGLCASNFLWALHAIHFVAAASELLAIRLMFSWTRNEDLAAATWRSLLALTTLGSFLFSGFRSSPVVDKDTLQIRRDADEETFSSCGKLSGSAVLRLVVNAGLLSKHVDSDVLPPVRRLKCGQLVACLPSPLVQKWTGPNARIRVFCAFVRVLWHEALWVPLVGLAYFAALIVRVPLLESLIEDVGSQAAKAVSALFLCSCAAEVCLSGFLEYVALRFSTQLKLLMEAALFTKMTRMSASALSEAPAGYLVSLVGVDCDQLHTAVLFFSQALSGLLCLPVVLWMLSKRVGVPPVAGCIAWPLASLALSVPVSWIQRGLWKRIVHYRDERLNKMADTLSCVRLVKFYAWEGAVTAAVSRWRAREGRFLFLSNLLDGFVDSLQSSSNSVMTLILLGTFAAVNQSVTLSAAHLFSALYMLSIMDIVFVNMPTVLRYRSMVSQGLQRMAKTLTAEEDEFGACARNNHEVENGAVLLENCTFAWSGPQEGSEEASGSDEPALCDVSLDVTPGALVGVVGLVGSGKSALLAAILGELRRLRGTVHVAGRVAYLPQSACIFNMSIRDNVLFGRRMETYRYHQVLEACDLTRDLELLPAGDLTEVGEKGETLSGGQKQRVALARAVYSNSDVYLIDDTLSGLDVHVAAKVFARVIGPDGLLRHKDCLKLYEGGHIQLHNLIKILSSTRNYFKTRIMVCNQGVFLNDVDKLLLLSKKRVHLYVSLSDLKADTEVPKALLFGSKQVSPTAKPKDNSYDALLRHEYGAFAQLTSQEMRVTKVGAVDLLRSLVTMSGACLPLAVLCISAHGVAVGLFLIWIKEWTDSSAASGVAQGLSTATWVAVLAALCLCDLLFVTLGGLLLALSFRRLSTSLHGRMVRSVLGSAMSFFVATPRGRLLNRFSTDLHLVDCQLYMTSKEVLQTVAGVLARLVVVGTQAPMACGLGVLSLGAYLSVAAVTVRASNFVRCQEYAWMSRVLQHLTETRDSMSSVRCYGAGRLMCRRFYRLVDGAVRPFWALVACVRLTRLSGAAAGFCAVAGSLLNLSMSAATASQSGVGLALSSSMSIPMLLAAINASLFFCFLGLIALQRAVEYTRLPPEDDCDVDCDSEREGAPNVPAVSPEAGHVAWPTEGEIAFEDFTASYQQGVLAPVLNCVSFAIKAREKVGVVGRTGAGKSSLILALLRVLRPSQGRIVIDGMDIASVPLRRLRSTITVIPQEPYLMKGSLRDNIDATQSHTDEEVWEALRKAHLANFVSAHPQGLMLEIGDGADNLSAGQRQLACLARALLRRPRVLLLDEATSRMDGDTEQLVHQTLREGFADCTVLTVAHRLHTVLDCDRILVMRDGSVVEFGTVAELSGDASSVFREMAEAAGIDLQQATQGVS